MVHIHSLYFLKGSLRNYPNDSSLLKLSINNYFHYGEKMRKVLALSFFSPQQVPQAVGEAESFRRLKQYGFTSIAGVRRWLVVKGHAGNWCITHHCSLTPHIFLGFHFLLYSILQRLQMFKQAPLLTYHSLTDIWFSFSFSFSFCTPNTLHCPDTQFINLPNRNVFHLDL